MADQQQPDRYGEQPAPAPDTIVEVFEENLPWEPVAGGQWYIVREPGTGTEKVLYRRPSGQFVGAVVDQATLRTPRLARSRQARLPRRRLRPLAGENGQRQHHPQGVQGVRAGDAPSVAQ